MMEIAPRIEMIETVVGGRPLYLYLLRGTDHIVLIDSGCAPDPEQAIFPQLTALGLRPTSIDLVINTHADTDHCGGNAALKRANPRVLLSCGEADREMIEDPAILWARRYNRYADRHGLAYDDAVRNWTMDMLDDPQPVDLTWTGGETLRLGRDWSVKVYHTPGHTPGHIIVYDPENHILIGGDVVNGAYCPDIKGRPALCPTYAHVDTYVSTIRFLRALEPAMFCSSHWPVKRGDEVAAFLDESAQFVEQVDQVLLAELMHHPGGTTLSDLIIAVASRLGDWPRFTDRELTYVLAGHLDRLVFKGSVRADLVASPARYSYC